MRAAGKRDCAELWIRGERVKAVIDLMDYYCIIPRFTELMNYEIEAVCFGVHAASQLSPI